MPKEIFSLKNKQRFYRLPVIIYPLLERYGDFLAIFPFTGNLWQKYARKLVSFSLWIWNKFYLSSYLGECKHYWALPQRKGSCDFTVSGCIGIIAIILGSAV